MTRIPGYYTAAELATAAGLTPNTIRWHCRNGNVAAEHTDRIWLIPTAAGLDFLRDQERYGRPARRPK